MEDMVLLSKTETQAGGVRLTPLPANQYYYVLRKEQTKRLIQKNYLLLSIFCRACLSDNRDFDLTRVLHGFFDLLGNITG